MISNATDHRATVLENRRINVERGVTAFGPVCSSVAGMALHHPEGRADVQEGSASAECATLCGGVIWSSPRNPAMDCARDEQISGESDRSSPYSHSESKMGAVSNRLAGRAECFAEHNFDCGNVRVYRRGHCACPNFGGIQPTSLARRRSWRATAADREHVGWDGRAYFRSRFKNRRAL